MSIILKGIDLPNSGQIEIIIRPHGKVFSNTRGIYAEAIQIPKDHGRLIDDDKITKEYYKNPSYLNLCKLLNNAPTILEAEGGDAK